MNRLALSVFSVVSHRFGLCGARTPAGPCPTQPLILSGASVVDFFKSDAVPNFAKLPNCQMHSVSRWWVFVLMMD